MAHLDAQERLMNISLLIAATDYPSLRAKPHGQARDLCVYVLSESWRIFFCLCFLRFYIFKFIFDILFYKIIGWKVLHFDVILQADNTDIW